MTICHPAPSEQMEEAPSAELCGATWGDAALTDRPLLSCLNPERRQHGTARIRQGDYFCPAASRIRSAMDRAAR